MNRPGRNVFEVVTETPVPVVAALNGAAVAGGFELALACDLRVAAPGIKLGLPEAQIGMGANFGSVVLPKRVPMGIAMEMLLTGDYVTSEVAERWGLVNRITDDVLPTALQLAERIAANAPISVRRMKETARQGPGAAAVAGAAPRRRAEPLPERGPRRGHRRLPGEAPAAVDRALSVRSRSPAGAGRRRTARPATG